MIVIDSVEMSKNPVDTSEAFILKVTAREELATWGDVKTINSWADILGKTWQDIKLKIF